MKQVISACFTLALSAAFANAYDTVCYGDIGCFTNAPPWGDTPARPISDLPESPEDVNTRFFLDTRGQNGLEIQYNNVNNVLKSSTFNKTLVTRLIIMGYVDENDDEDWMESMSQALLASEDQNVIRVSWKGASLNLNYATSAVNAEVAGATAGLLVTSVQQAFNIPASSFHCIGHSIGAHVCAYVGNNVLGLGRISGLDPAGTYFEGTDAVVRLDQSDAIFVDVMHTDADGKKGYGTSQESGDVDFWPNGGAAQPACDQNIVIGIAGTIIPGQFVECNHMIAVDFYIESILTPCPFKSYPCDSYGDFLSGNCVTCDGTGCPRMGYFANDTSSLVNGASTYLQTQDQSPYCEYMTYVSVTIGDNVKSIDGTLYVTLAGTKITTEQQQLGSSEFNLRPGNSYKALTYYSTDPGDVTSAIVEWKQKEIELGRQTISVSEVAVWKGDVQLAYYFCGDENYDMKEKTPYVFEVVC